MTFRAFQLPRLWRRLLLSPRSLGTRPKPAPAARSHSRTETPPPPTPPLSPTPTPGSRWRNATDSPPEKQRYWRNSPRRLDQLIFLFFIPFIVFFIPLCHVLHFLWPPVVSCCSSLCVCVLHLSASSMSVMMCVFSALLLLPQRYNPTACPLQLSTSCSQLAHHLISSACLARLSRTFKPHTFPFILPNIPIHPFLQNHV